jgi:conjugal transfer ATP-binding protein TraC
VRRPRRGEVDEQPKRRAGEDVRSHLLVEKIEDGLLYVRDEGPRIVLEATGVNFELKSQVEQTGLLEVMAELLSYLQDPIQILVRSRVYEPDEYFESLESWRRAWPQAKRDLREQRLAEYKEKVRSLAEGHEIKDRRFYIVVPFWQPELQALMAKARRRPAVKTEEAAAQLGQKERQIQAVLWRAGIKTRRLASAEIEELFYYSYDPVMARIQKMRARSAPAREIRVRPLDPNETASIERRVGDVRQMIVPAALEVRADHIVSQNRETTYLRSLYVHDYPRDVEGNWLKDVLSLDFNLDVSLHIRPLDPQHARRRLDANERELSGTLGAVADDAPTARDLAERLEDIAYAKEEFRQKSKWFQFALYFMPYASSLEGLDRATKAIEDRLAGLQFRTQRAIYRQEQGLNSVLPQATDRLKQTRGISTRPLAAAFPFNAADQIEASGYLFGVVGRQDQAKSLLVLNPRGWDNPHLLVLGWSGNGKSHNAKEKCLAEWIAGSHVAVIDPRSEWTQLAEHCHGEVIPVHLGSPKTMNLWDLPQEGERNPFTSKVPQLINFWRLALGYMPEEELQLLDGAITSAYGRVGIDPGNPACWGGPPPITSDFQTAIMERYGEDQRTRLAARSLAGRLDKFTRGYLGPLFNQRSNVNLANDFVVFDVRTVRTEQSDLLPLVYWLILNHLRTWMTSQIRRRTICIDEFWSLARHPEGMTFVDEMSRTARHAFTQLVLISQSVSDMLSSQQAIASLSSMATTILHKQHPDHVARVMETFHLSDEEARRLQNARRGQCLVITGNGEHVTMQTVEYEPEHELYCTEPFKCGRQHRNGAQPQGQPAPGAVAAGQLGPPV